MAFLMVHEVRETLCPRIFEFYKDLDELVIVLQLRVDDFYVLFIFLQKVAEVHEALLDALREDADCFRLVRTDSPEDAFSSQQDIVA